ncbi:ATP-binding protein [Streptomyces sp. NPDC001848]|uniref:ATP-binding protein n=1 Tax=Streptomyces sp. NPDC001848 TaxID=3364618 RepID=UPI00367AB006
MASVIPPASLGTDAPADRSGPGSASGLRPGAATERRFRFELAAHPGSVTRARQLTRARLARWEVCEDTCDTAVLVVSELVTNAIVHTAGEHVVCELHDEDDLVRIAVRDEGCAPGEPRPAPQRPEEEHGRGLLLVSALCRAWGAQEAGSGLLVWAELARGTDQSTPTRLPRPTQPSRDLSCSGDRSRAREGATARPDPSGERATARSDQGWSARKPPTDGGARFDLGWSAKRPPTEGRVSGAEPSLGTGTAWL